MAQQSRDLAFREAKADTIEDRRGTYLDTKLLYFEKRGHGAPGCPRLRRGMDDEKPCKSNLNANLYQ